VPNITIEFTLRSENQRLREASVGSAFEEEGFPRATRLLTGDPKVRLFTLPLHNPSKAFIYGRQNILAGTGVKPVRSLVTSPLRDSESNIGPDARLQIGRLDCAWSIEGCFTRATTRLTSTDHPERCRFGKYYP
jgi:hypothetical protein